MDRNKLSRRLYITYKARINAAERLKNTNAFIQSLNIYYSLFLTALSIYSVASATKTVSLIITIYSVVVTVTIVFLAAQNYGERAKGLKNNYVAILKLHNRINEDTSDIELQKINAEYDDLIANSENHSEYDYYKACMSIKEERSTLNQRQKFILYFKYWGSMILKVFLIIVPFFLRYVVALLEWLITV